MHSLPLLNSITILPMHGWLFGNHGWLFGNLYANVVFSTCPVAHAPIGYALADLMFRQLTWFNFATKFAHQVTAFLIVCLSVF